MFEELGALPIAALRSPKNARQSQVSASSQHRTATGEPMRSANCSIKALDFSRMPSSPYGLVLPHCAQTARKLIGLFHPLPLWSIVVAGLPHTWHFPPSLS